MSYLFNNFSASVHFGEITKEVIDGGFAGQIQRGHAGMM
jgi:hypothetical protein